jgi:hypothetical protein
MKREWERFPLSGAECKITYSVAVCDGKCAARPFGALMLVQSKLFRHPKPQLF